MKKITLLLFFLFISVSGYSQLFGLTEGFEDSAPSGPLPQTWSLATGNWAIFERNSDPNFGSGQSWGINAFAAGLQYQGSQCASVSRDQINQGNVSEDFLATSIVSVPASGVTELHFWTRTFTSGIQQGTVYKLMVASTAQSQTDPDAYVLLQQWTDADLILPTTNFNIWTEKTVTIPAFLQGQDVYFAFVREYTQPSSALDGDRWLIDNVGVNAQCISPVTAATVVTGSTTANLFWSNPSGATSWNIIVTPTGGGAPITYPIYSGSQPFSATGLTPNTTYSYQVSAICSTGFSSPLSNASASFTTQIAPPICGGNLVDSGGPAGNYGNNENVSTTVNPVTAGEVVTVTFTQFNTQANTDFLKIYDGPDASFPLLANLSGTVLPGSYTGTSVSGALTFVFTSNGTTVSAGYAANITCGPAPACRIPTGVSIVAGSITTTSASLNWTQPANADSSVAAVWDVIALPAGSPAPNAGSVPTANDIIGPLPFNLTGLSSAVCYDVYVRAVCNGTTNSAWSTVAVAVCTLVAPPVCGGNFVDSGGTTVNYGNNENLSTVISPITVGDAVTVTFTAFNTEAGNDILRVYDGNGTIGTTLLATLSGTTLPPSFTSSAVGGQLTFVFTSNGTVTAAGWIANVTCAPPPACTKPIALSAGNPTFNSVLLTWVQPANPDSSQSNSWQVLALPCLSPAPNAASTGFVTANSNTAFPLTGLASNTCFDIYVRAICSGSDVSTWEGPVTITTLIAPPVCGGNFVDVAGPTTNYANSSDSTVVICPVTLGDLVTVTFTSFVTEATYDGLYVFDGNSITAPQIASANPAGNVPGGLAGSYWGTLTGGNLPSFTSTSADGCLTFRFRSDPSVNNPGWIANVTCAPPPTCRKPTAIANSGATSNSVILNWTQPTNPDNSIASAWQVLALPCGSPAPTAASTGFVNAPTNINFPLTGLTSATCYDIYIRAICSGTDSSTWGGPTSFTTQVAPPVCGGNFVDAAGPTANYANSSDSTTTICPTIAGQVVTVTFTSFNTEANFDALYVFDGNSIAAPQITSVNPAANVPGGLAGGFWGVVIPGPFTSTSADGCLTFRFRSDPSFNNPGWVSNVTCALPPTCRTPTAITATTVTSNSVILNWTQPTNPDNSIASAWQVLALPCGSPAPTAASTGFVNAPTRINFPLTGLTSATCYDIYIRAICSGTDSSTWGGPRTITTLVAPPVCGGNFVDEGGPTGNYLVNSNVTTIICPTNPGEIVTVTFTQFNTEANWDGLYVYNGTGVNAAEQFASANGPGTVPGGIAGSYWGNLTGANLPGPFTSTSGDGCLTFVFRSDGSVVNPGWVSTVTCSPAPTCARPIISPATFVTQTSATLAWTQPLNPNGSNATAWEYLVLPAGAPVPTGPGIPLTTTTIVATPLTSGTGYVLYVRAICSSTDSSEWAVYNFATLPTNDECANATFAIVNQNLNCVQTTFGTLAGATASAPPTTCGGATAANDDVWFTFTATAATHVISFNNVLPATPLSYAIYSGTCSGLTEVGCNTGAGLTSGTVYYIRVFSTGTAPVFTNFNLCIGTLPCTEAPAFCTGQTVTYANATNVPSLGTIGCLFTSPNPAFFFLQVNQAGPLSYLISQVDNSGAPRDVDYVAWGPFTDLNSACSGVPANPLPGLTPPLTPAQGCSGTLHACSYSAAPTEIMCIPNAQLCQVYVIMITNFSNAAGTVTFTQTNAGGGTTACFPINTFNYAQTYYCQNQPNPTPILAPAAVAGVYTSTPGLIIDSATGAINLNESMPGAYVITSTSATTIGGTCNSIPFITTTRTVIITAPASAIISYASPSYCNNITTSQPVTITGTTGGIYSATPAGLLINATTGDILPIASAPGIYTVSYTIAAFGGCAAFTTTTQVEIINAVVPTFTQVAPICPGDTLAPLLTSSNDTPPITGTWSPALDNTQTTTYTFTPDAGQCARTTTMTINVGSTTPSFDPIAPICQGAPLAALPTLSTNGITGNWSPALDNTQTTTYTFTPTSGVCVGSTTLTIQVLPATILPTFNAIPAICPNGVISALPTTSLNGITGSWSPTLDNTQTTTYTFTPDTGQCALNGTLTIIVNPPLVVTVNNPTFCPGSTGTVVATPAIPGSYTYTWTVPVGVANPGNVDSFVTSTPGTYTVVIDQVSSFCNTDFETPTAVGVTPNLFNENLVPCWDTTAPDGIIEIWPPGFEGVTAYSGNQLIELNANTVGTLFQDFVVIPGTTMSVSFAHRGRQGNDVVGVEIGPVGGPYVSLGNFTDGNTAWGLHTVNYTIPTGSGNNYTLRFVSVSSTGGDQSVGNLLDSISISALSCTSAPASGVATFQTLPDPTVTVTDPTCAVPTGTIEVTSPLNSGSLPSNLFISEVTDANAGSLTYIEIYNGTGAAVDLSSFKLQTFNNGSSTFTSGCDNILSGILNNNSTHVVAVGSATNLGSVTPNQVFAGCTGVNTDDCIKLTTSTNTVVDLWGRTDGVNFTPSNQAGYTYRRNNTASVPSTTWNPADWTTTDPEDYTNVGSYTPASATYEYSLDGGTYQAGTTFSGVASGAHTITVHNLVTGCFSLPFDVVVGPIVGELPTVTTITYTTPVCQSSTTPVLPDTSAAGFTSGGTYSEDTTVSTGLSINATTGEINLVTSTLGFHTVKYEVLFDPITCQAAGVSTFIIEIKTIITAVVGFSYTSPVCKIATVTTVSPTLNTGFTSGGTFSSTTGLAISSSTGVIDLVNSTAGTYTVTYSVAADPANCQAANSFTFPITITPATTPIVEFSYDSPICDGETTNPLPILAPGFVTGGIFGPANLVDPVTGEFMLPATAGQQYTVTYTLPADTANCQNAGNSSATIAISLPIQIELSGGCQRVYVLTALPINNSFDPLTATYSWEDSQGIAFATTQSIDVPSIGTYTVTVTVNGCSTKSAPFNVDSISCVIQKGISVNNDGLNDTFDLTGFDVKKLTIFNRLGMKVYSRSNYINEWGGKSDDGDDLPDGTYYFIIDRNSGETKTGWIYINRAQ